ncbi:3-phosphoshikimate 1-carboxyvinyltransferase 1 [compost metagenome]
MASGTQALIPDSRVVEPGGPLRGRLCIPGDKSLSHRAVMLGALAEGTSRVRNFLSGEDCLGTIRCYSQLGVSITADDASETAWTIHGGGLHGLKEPGDVLDVGNSGTTMRLMLGVLAGGILGHACLTGDASIRRRPMLRVVDPLRAMGARIDGRQEGALAPLSIRGGSLRPLDYASPVASAQIKSALLLAGLFIDGETRVSEPARSRDHTERMLRAMGAELAVDGLSVAVRGGRSLKPFEFEVPGDISSAAFWLVAGSIVPGSEILLEGVGLNPTRTGVLDALRRMGADITEERPREALGEPVADLRVRYAELTATTIEGDEIPRLVDEIPILSLAAACATGRTLIRDAGELRVKESDRLAAIARELGKLGVVVKEHPDGLEIEGGTRWRSAEVESQDDHRMAMTLALASLQAPRPIRVGGTRSTETSYPGFWEDLARLR